MVRRAKTVAQGRAGGETAVDSEAPALVVLSLSLCVSLIFFFAASYDSLFVVRVYPQVNNGVYRCGFATAQGPYDAAFTSLFEGLDRLESILAKQRYLNSNEQLTLADVRLFTTLIRFDTVYHGHFKVRHTQHIQQQQRHSTVQRGQEMRIERNGTADSRRLLSRLFVFGVCAFLRSLQCNKHKLKEYSNLYNYMLELYQLPAVRATVSHEHIMKHYMCSHKSINPNGIVSGGPPLEELDVPSNRTEKFGGKKQ